MAFCDRLASNDPNCIDLHGASVEEAVAIVEETLQRSISGPSSTRYNLQHASNLMLIPVKPLKIITGRGAHSANQISVLKPAIRKALVEGGWSVTAWDAGLIVNGRRR